MYNVLHSQFFGGAVMGLSLTAFRVAVSKVGKEQAHPIVHGKGGVTRIKTIVVIYAIAAALRLALDKKQLVLSGGNFFEVKGFIAQHFGNYLTQAISKLPEGEVCAGCDLSTFAPNDLVVVEGPELEYQLELSIERMVYSTLVEAIEDYMTTDQVSLDKLVVMVDGVYQATVTVCLEAGRYLSVIERGKNLDTK